MSDARADIHQDVKPAALSWVQQNYRDTMHYSTMEHCLSVFVEAGCSLQRYSTFWRRLGQTKVVSWQIFRTWGDWCGTIEMWCCKYRTARASRIMLARKKKKKKTIHIPVNFIFLASVFHGFKCCSDTHCLDNDNHFGQFSALCCISTYHSVIDHFQRRRRSDLYRKIIYFFYIVDHRHIHGCSKIISSISTWRSWWRQKRGKSKKINSRLIIK